MSVVGSIDTVALGDLLNLLGTTRKTGRLQVSADRVSGHVWLLDGEVIASEIGRASSDLDAIFQLLRVTSGGFNFDTNVAMPIPNHRVPLLELLDDARSRLAEWREIELVVPSLASVVRLMPELRGSEAMVGADQWRVIAAVGHGSGVVDILDRVDLEEFEGCRVIKELVDIGFLRIEAPDQRAEVTGPPVEEVEVAPPEIPVASHVPAIPALVSPQIGAEVDPSIMHIDSELDEPLSRGTLLKFLSSMRT